MGLLELASELKEFPARGNRSSSPYILYRHRELLNEWARGGFRGFPSSYRKVYGQDNRNSFRVWRSRSWNLLLKEWVKMAELRWGWSEQRVMDELTKEVDENTEKNKPYRMKSLELIGKALGMWKEKIENTNTNISKIEIIMDNNNDDDEVREAKPEKKVDLYEEK